MTLFNNSSHLCHRSTILENIRWTQTANALLCQLQHKDALFPFKSKHRKRILVLRLTQKSVRSLRSADILQNGATVTRRDTEETRMRYFHSNQSVNIHRKRILVLRLTQKSVRSLRSADILQNGATVTRRDTEETNCYFYFLCLQKVFSSLHKIQIEPLMADGLFWRCLSYFSGPWQC